MPVKPEGTVITLAGQTLIAGGIRFSTESQFFQRLEFSNQVLRQAPELTGAQPIFNQLVGGKVIQYNSGCGGSTLRSVAPDDANLDNVFRRFDMKRWEIQGLATDAAAVEAVFQIAKAHKILLSRFEAHLQMARAYVSIDFLESLKLVDLSYLETTGYNISGQSLGVGSPTTATNILISTFVPDVEYEVPLNSAGTSSQVLRAWSCVVEQRVNVPARSVTY